MLYIPLLSGLRNVSTNTGIECHETSNMKSHTLVGSKIVDHSDVVGLHIHSRLNTWLQWIGQKQVLDGDEHTFRFWDLVRIILEI